MGAQPLKRRSDEGVCDRGVTAFHSRFLRQEKHLKRTVLGFATHNLSIHDACLLMYQTTYWGIRSIGRSPALHAGGTGIETRILHFPSFLLFLLFSVPSFPFLLPFFPSVPLLLLFLLSLSFSFLVSFFSSSFSSFFHSAPSMWSSDFSFSFRSFSSPFCFSFLSLTYLHLPSSAAYRPTPWWCHRAAHTLPTCRATGHGRSALGLDWLKRPSFYRCTASTYVSHPAAS